MRVRRLKKLVRNGESSSAGQSQALPLCPSPILFSLGTGAFSEFLVENTFAREPIRCDDAIAVSDIALAMSKRQPFSIECGGRTYVGDDECQSSQCTSSGDSHDFEFFSYTTGTDKPVESCS